MRLDPRLLGCVAWLLLGAGCGPGPGGEIAVRLVRAEDPLGERAGGFDRLRVARAVCQIVGQGGGLVALAEAALDLTSAPGEQQLALGRVPAGDGYFARVLGLGLDGSVVECGATGPFSLRAGERLPVTLVIGAPPAGDPLCEGLCAAHADCPAGWLCPSPCARGEQGAECVRALCAPARVGAACATEEDCDGLTCLGEAEGYPGGYCSAACGAEVACPAASHCKPPGQCLKACLGDADCRAGYACALVSGTDRGCLPE